MLKYHKHTKESLSVVVNASSSWAEVCRKLDRRKGSTGLQSYLRILAERFLIDTSHFTAKRWSERKTTSPKDIESYLVKDCISMTSDTLKKRLIREGVFVDVCARCGSAEWFEKCNRVGSYQW